MDDSSRRKSTRRGSAAFLMFKDLECKEEMQKVRLAGFLRELHKLAIEENKEKVRESLNETVHSTTTAQSTADAPTDGSISLKDVELAELTPPQANAKIEALHGGEKFDSDSLIHLIQESVKCLGDEETVVDLRALEPKPQKLTVVGDLHGSLACLQNVLKLVDMNEITATGSESTRVVVFDGDFVDRGEHSLEVLATLLLLKLSHPTNVFLLRGNHEDSMTASTYGFREEIEDKYGYEKADDIWYEFGFLFASFPIIARSETAAIMHGGIPMEEFDLDVVNEIGKELRCELKTVVDPYDDDERLIQGIIWSDPSAEDGINFSDRGAGFQFGPDIIDDFLERHELKYLIRAHEPFEDGFNHQDIDEGGRGVITVFSTANYPDGEGTNRGAVLHLDEETKEFETVSFEFQEKSGGGAKPYEVMLKSFVDDNKSKLTKAFREAQDDNGMVSIGQWKDIVAETLELPDVPWSDLQPELAPTTEPEGTEIDWQAFLNKVSTKIPKTESLAEDQLSLLHEHKDKFLNIFQILDTDGSGTIDAEEFTSGIKMLNDEIGEGGEKMQNFADLFSAFDIDGDGEISIEEFVNALNNSATLKGVTDALDSNQVEALQQNHEMLLVAFKYLDTDHSGAIDREEFQRGIELLNKRLADRHQVGDPMALFDLLDMDGNGEIDLNEFNQMFRVL
ncbi:protein phosphatase PP1 [Seminavis robusta]|uniref:Serine/threonine-protein phosphatase n=1 Tax=Seminavis robusta TaxID=568900 RepID=A0A9N8HB87_9STRA|nr:protein phosphatase PP1 [Seminavis robusta]|eukprot:Sro268_g103780.1 protein phosphatase PP1 (680) ;mRNA; r:64544-66867